MTSLMVSRKVLSAGSPAWVRRGHRRPRVDGVHDLGFDDGHVDRGARAHAEAADGELEGVVGGLEGRVGAHRRAAVGLGEGVAAVGPGSEATSSPSSPEPQAARDSGRSRAATVSARVRMGLGRVAARRLPWPTRTGRRPRSVGAAGAPVRRMPVLGPPVSSPPRGLRGAPGAGRRRAPREPPGHLGRVGQPARRPAEGSPAPSTSPWPGCRHRGDGAGHGRHRRRGPGRLRASTVIRRAPLSADGTTLVCVVVDEAADLRRGPDRRGAGTARRHGERGRRATAAPDRRAGRAPDTPRRCGCSRARTS